jgi:hypothetical protein
MNVVGWNDETCDDIISHIFTHSKKEACSMLKKREAKSVKAFTMRYMAWKNLIQFFDSPH